MSDYDTDILTWSERQSALLRRRAAGGLANADAIAALPETIDGQPPLPVSEICRVALDDLLSRDP